MRSCVNVFEFNTKLRSIESTDVKITIDSLFFIVYSFNVEFIHSAFIIKWTQKIATRSAMKNQCR